VSKWYGVGDASTQRVRCTQDRSYQGEIGRKVHVLTETHGLFEEGESPGQIALAQGELTKPPIGKHEATRVSNLLSNPEPFFSEGTAFSERAQLGMT
jgi:hypothetical protein